MTDKFTEFLSKLNIEKCLSETIQEGYKSIFQEGINSWESNNSPYFPFVNPVGEPMGSYQNIMKQIPSQITASGGSGDNTRSAENEYKYEPALAGVHRDLKDETINEWEPIPKMPPIKVQKEGFVKRLINTANKHIPNVGDNMFTPINYYTNFHMGMYGTDQPNPVL